MKKLIMVLSIVGMLFVVGCESNMSQTTTSSGSAGAEAGQSQGQGE